MDESPKSLICLQVAEYRESGRELSPALDAHADSCLDCHAVSDMDVLLKRYVHPEISLGGRGKLWERIKPEQPRWQISFRYAAAAAIVLLIGLNLYVRRLGTPREVATKPQIHRYIAVQLKPKTPELASIVLETTGAVMFKPRGGKGWLPVHRDGKLTAEETVRIPAHAHLRFAFPDHTEVALQEDSLGTLHSVTDSNQGRDAFYLVVGKAFIHHHGNPLTIFTPKAAIVAIGTEFSVSHEGETTKVRVFSGAVRVRGQARQVVVGRAQEVSLVPSSHWAVKRFTMRQAAPWERNEITVAYMRDGGMMETVRRPLRVRHMPPIPLRNVELRPHESLEKHESNAAPHAHRLEIKQEEDMRRFEERVRQREEELLKQM